MMNRDFNSEARDNERKYYYGFDLDVMHPFMMRAFTPFLRPGNALEMGCFKGDFTRHLLRHFDRVDAIEAASEGIEAMPDEIKRRTNVIHGMFETASLSKKYDHIFLTHVLEHLDEPVEVMKRINNEWLSDSGRFFLVCPNANAPSRQIAVKMGLIPHNTAVTPGEAKHGHRITYTLDTLERDARAAGLNVVYRTGIFFKALANFQWDRLLQTDIISPEYLEGCYQLGQLYPDLCSSIFLLCEKGSVNQSAS